MISNRQDPFQWLRRVGWFFFLFPIVYLISLAILFDASMDHCLDFLMTEVFWAVSFISWFVAYGFIRMRRWAWYAFVFLQPALCLSQGVFFMTYAESYHKYFILFGFVLSQIVFFIILSKRIRVPYFFPKIRWWENQSRYRVSLPVHIEGGTSAQEGFLLDLSFLGCFIKSFESFQKDQSLILRFESYGSKVQCSGKVVWLASSSITCPKGIGVQFFALDKQNKKSLKQILRRLKRLSIHYRKNRYWMSPEQFLKIWEEIETTKEMGFRWKLARNSK